MNTEKEIFLWQRYIFNRDMGDDSRAAYWLERIKEYNQTKNN